MLESGKKSTPRPTKREVTTPLMLPVLMASARKPRQQMLYVFCIFRDKYILLTANEDYEEFEFMDSLPLHINYINEPIVECTDNVQTFLSTRSMFSCLSMMTALLCLW